jgi:hypothetical protein
MTKFGLLGAAAVVVSSVPASPVMAQQVIYNPGYCAQYFPDTNCQNLGPGNPYTGDYQRRMAYRNSGYRDYGWNSNGWNSNDSWTDNRWDRRRDSGFWPADVAAGAVAGAVGIAGAIATAPFRGDSYAYYNDDSYGYATNSYGYATNVYRGGPHQSYVPQSYYRQSYQQLNGFVCQPGTWFTGEDGLPHLCR